MTKLFLVFICFFNLQIVQAEEVVSANPDIAKFFNEFGKDNIDLADSFYAEDIHFQDPIVDIKGLQPLKDYYAGLYKNVISIRF